MLNLWQHVFLTVTLYVDIILLNPHLIYSFKESLLELESYRNVTKIKRNKRILDLIILVCCFAFYFLILLFFRLTFSYYPYPFVMQYDYNFWLIMLVGIAVTYILYFWYEYFSKRMLDYNADKVNEEHTLEMLNKYLKNIEQE